MSFDRLEKIIYDNTEKRREIFILIGTIMNKYYINKVAWRKIFLFLKTIKKLYIQNEKRTRRFIESIYWIARTGAQWRELPKKYGKWNSVFSRFNSWSKKNIWILLMEFCAKDADLEYLSIDSTIVRPHACSTGYGDQSEQGIGRSVGGLSTKIHLLADSHGNPIKLLITEGQKSDFKKASELLNNINGSSYILADRGYDSKKIRNQILEQGCIPVIPSKSNSKNPVNYDKHIYKERYVIECFFSKVKHFRRVFSRFDKSIGNFASFVSFVGTLIWLR